MERPYVLCGLGRVGWRVLEYLRAAGADVVVVDNRCPPDDPRLAGARLVQGDCRRPEVLTQAGVPSAAGVLIVTSEDLVSLSTALAVHQLNPQARIVVRMFKQGLLARLGKSWNLAALSTSALAAPLLALIARTGVALGSFSVVDERRLQLAEVTVWSGSPLAGLPVGEIPAHCRCHVVGQAAPGKPSRFFQEIDRAGRVALGDRMVLCGRPEDLAPLHARPDESAGPELLWAGKVRRLGRMLGRTLAEVDLAVKICTGVLLAVITISTIIFNRTMNYDSIPDALYRTVRLMATAADMEGEGLEPGGWQKVFVSMLRIAGAALTAAFTAILTNYLVRAHLGGALEVRRIPESGHVVVCGLGNIGYRVALELLREQEQVVVVERSRDNPFTGATRRRGAAVVVGDATLADVLRQAHAPQARAVVAVTSNELVNLEVALLAREMNPAQRVVLRLTDPQLARTLRESANIRLALSVPDLTAPALVASLFGDEVRGVFLVEGRLLAAVDLVVHPAGDPWEGKAVQDLATEYGMEPVALTNSTGTGPAPTAALRPGDRLSVLASFGDLQRLLRRERPALLTPARDPAERGA